MWAELTPTECSKNQQDIPCEIRLQGPATHPLLCSIRWQSPAILGAELWRGPCGKELSEASLKQKDKNKVLRGFASEELNPANNCGSKFSSSLNHLSRAFPETTGPVQNPDYSLVRSLEAEVRTQWPGSRTHRTCEIMLAVNC